MLYAKFQGNQPSCSGKDDFLLGFYHKWTWWPFWLTRTIWRHFSFPLARRLYMKLNWNQTRYFRRSPLKCGRTFIQPSFGEVNEWPWSLAFTKVHVVSTLISQTTFVLEKWIVLIFFFFFSLKTQSIKFNLAIKEVEVNLGSLFSEIW